jgi:hypothetical protein
MSANDMSASTMSNSGISTSVRGFVGILFTAIGLSFLVTTGVLIWEFWDARWPELASFYSHLFLFFPTFGIVTLFAFYTPACVFTDMYMRHVPYGVVRYGLGMVVVVAASLWGAYALTSATERSIFEVRPEILLADREQPGGCLERGMCERLPILDAVDNMRRVSQTRVGLSDLVRNCRPDALKDALPNAIPERRYCFASTPLPAEFSQLRPEQRTTDAQCCLAQARFTQAVKDLHDRDGRSLTARVHTALLPFKLFFAQVLFVISIMLAVRRKSMEKHYLRYLPGIERGVLVGAVAMVVFPVMSHAFLQSAALLYHGGGPSGGYRSIAPGFSFMLGAWGLLLLFFFYGRQNEKVQNLARIGGMIGSAVAVVKYDQIVDLSVRGFGSGAGFTNMIGLCIAALAALVLISTWTNREFDAATRAETGSSPGADVSELPEPDSSGTHGSVPAIGKPPTSDADR